MSTEDRSARLAEIRERLQTTQAKRAVEAFEARCGRFGEKERRVVPIEDVEVRSSGNSAVAFTAKGYASVFDRKSLDLGGFQEVIESKAFDNVLDSAPDVHLLWDHDTRLALARTRSKSYTLELRTDPKGLRFYAPVAPTTFADDLRVLMEGGIIDQASFAFTIASDTWEIRDEGKPTEFVLRTIHEVSELFDVTITAQGAYPQTDSSVVRGLALAYAMDAGRLAELSTEEPGPEADATDEVATPDNAAPADEPVDEDAAQDEPVDAEGDPDATDTPVEEESEPADADEDATEDDEGDSADGTEDEPGENRAKRLARLRMAAAIARHHADLE